MKVLEGAEDWEYGRGDEEGLSGAAALLWSDQGLKWLPKNEVRRGFNQELVL